MKPVRANLLPVGRKHAGAFLLLAVISLICVAFSMTGRDNFDFARREILFRRIAHELLLRSGDSSSRVLPVKRITENEYQVSFEKPFSFQPDTLVNITRHVLGNDPLVNDYVVNMINCDEGGVAYGYAIAGDKKNDIVTCLGRTQPVGCYIMQITLKPAGLITAKNGFLFGIIALLAMAAYLVLRPWKLQNVSPATANADAGDRDASVPPTAAGAITLGSMIFYAEKRTLQKDDRTVDLTKTEARVLRIFALSPNQVIERSRLQKEIWEDDGVIVGRSLDMFISKLRKKLEQDPAIRLAVVRGKGYRLEIS